MSGCKGLKSKAFGEDILFFGPNSYHCVALSVTVSHSLPQCSCWNLVDVKIHATSSKSRNQVLTAMLKKLEQIKSHVVHAWTKQKTWYQKFQTLLTKVMLLIVEQKKKLKKIKITWICQGCYMDLLMLLRGFVKGVLCISRPLPNKTRLKFKQLFKDCWSFCHELKVLNESKYLIP